MAIPPVRSIRRAIATAGWRSRATPTATTRDPVPRPPPRRVALAVGALVRLRRHERADRLPRPDPQGGDRRLPRDGHDPGRHPALREGQHRLPARALARAAHHEPAARAPGAGLHRRDQGRARRAHRSRSSRSAASTATTTSSPATASWPRTPSFVRALEEAGLTFIGPCSYTQTAAGAKDEAKRTAIENDVSVTPGVNDATVRTLLRKHPDRAALAAAARRSTGSSVAGARRRRAARSPTLAERCSRRPTAQRIDLFTDRRARRDAAARSRAPAGGAARAGASG